MSDQSKENEIEALKQELVDKGKESESSQRNIEAKITRINELNDKINELESLTSSGKESPGLIDSIKEIMTRKGFLSDREFDQLLE